MIKSMTGFGRAKCELPNKTVTVEIRSLNSKQLDLNLRIPTKMRAHEAEIRNEAAKSVQRGKVDVSFNYEFTTGEAPAEINADIYKTYFNKIKKLNTELGFEADNSDVMASVMRLPGVLNIDTNDEDEDEWNKIFETYKQALNEFNAYREKEGAALIADIFKHVTCIEEYLSEVVPYEKDRINQVKARILSSLQELGNDVKIDKNRFEQELIYYLEKLDITEEKVRLKQHCNYFRQTVNDENPGRKIGFICQEMGREINTLGSKACEANIQKLVVKMKDELEKIKEQILNIL